MKRLAALTFVAIAGSVNGAIVESYKLESNSFFAQTTIGIGVPSNLNATIELPGLKWSSPLTISQFNRVPPGPADILRLNSVDRHLVAIQPGDPVPGPRFEWHHAFESRVGINGDLILVYFAGDIHGSGVDAVCSISVAKVGPVDIDFWSNFLFGMHVFKGDSTSTLLGKILEEGPNALKGATGVMIDRNGRQTLIGASIEGWSPQRVASTKVRFGPPSSGGPTVIDIGGSDAWVGSSEIGAMLAKSAEVPAQFLPALESGECYLEVLSNDLPPVRLTARLTKVNRSQIYQPSLAMVELGTAFGGDVESVKNSDDDVLAVLLDENDSTAQVFLQGYVLFNPLPQLEFWIESRASRSDLLEFVHVKRIFEDRWDYASGRIATVGDSRYAVMVSNLDGAYTTPATGNCMVRMIWVPTQDLQASDGWTVGIDLFEFRSGPTPG